MNSGQSDLMKLAHDVINSKYVELEIFVAHKIRQYFRNFQKTILLCTI